jgi:hypothetical protein
MTFLCRTVKKVAKYQFFVKTRKGNSVQQLGDKETCMKVGPAEIYTPRNGT